MKEKGKCQGDQQNVGLSNAELVEHVHQRPNRKLYLFSIQYAVALNLQPGSKLTSSREIRCHQRLVSAPGYCPIGDLGPDRSDSCVALPIFSEHV